MSFLRETAASLALLAAATSVWAQQPEPRVETDERIQIRRPINYAFRVEPMVHRLEARRGQTLPVTFQVFAKDQPSTVIIKTVALRQQENGVIMPDEDTPAPGHLWIENPGQFNIDPGEVIEVRGEVRLPADSRANFHSYGLLIKDIGRQLDAADPAADDEPSVGINFITQYLCRADVRVLGVRGESISKLELEAAELTDADGLPMARVWVRNPTDAALEFQMRCEVTSDNVLTRQARFPLVMPVRASRTDDIRLSARILAGTRLRMEDLVPYPLFPGDYELTVETLDDSRPVSSRTFPVTVLPEEFPALRTTFAQVADRVTAVPAQVELSLRNGGNRLVPLTFNNSSSEIVDIQLTPRSSDGASFEWLRVRPERLRLEPGQERKALVTLGANRDVESHRFAAIVATAATADGESRGEHHFPVALVGRNANGPQLNVASIEYSTDSEQPAFLVQVENGGELHLPLKGELLLVAEKGQPRRAVGGHGRWLMPGATDRIHFPLESRPEAGLYELRLQIQTGDPETPYEFRQVLEFNAPN